MDRAFCTVTDRLYGWLVGGCRVGGGGGGGSCIAPLVLTLNLWHCHGCFTIFMSFLHDYLMSKTKSIINIHNEMVM